MTRRIDITPEPGRFIVRFGGATVLETGNALSLKEGDHPAVLYFPRADAAMDHFRPTRHTTHCPWKGDASYFSLVAGDRTAENAVWSYETPSDACAPIREHLAFYPDKVEIARHD